MGKLRVEESKPVVVQTTVPGDTRWPGTTRVGEARSTDEWRTAAQNTAQRLAESEEKLRVLREQLDELRSRERKARDRADSANARANQTQAQLVAVMAERDVLKAQVATQEQLRRAIYDLVKGSQESLERFLASF